MLLIVFKFLFIVIEVLFLFWCIFNVILILISFFRRAFRSRVSFFFVFDLNVVVFIVVNVVCLCLNFVVIVLYVCCIVWNVLMLFLGLFGWCVCVSVLYVVFILCLDVFMLRWSVLNVFVSVWCVC